MTALALSSLSRRLNSGVQGAVMDDVFSRGRYATDASIYQMMPRAVVVPRTMEDVIATMAVAREEGVPVLPRGGGTSQCGQTVNEAVVLDLSKLLNRIVSIDPEPLLQVAEQDLTSVRIQASRARNKKLAWTIRYRLESTSADER